MNIIRFIAYTTPFQYEERLSALRADGWTVLYSEELPMNRIKIVAEKRFSIGTGAKK